MNDSSASTHADDAQAPDLAKPRSMTDLLHYRLARLEGFCGTLVTRLCEGEFGITRREWRFIGLLAALGPLTPSDLAVHASLNRGCTSKTLAALSDKGLVERHAVGGDARRLHVGLTLEGGDLHAQMFAALTAVNREILGSLADEDLARLSTLLAKMEAQAQRVAESAASLPHADRRHGGSRKRWLTRSGSKPGTAGDTDSA